MAKKAEPKTKASTNNSDQEVAAKAATSPKGKPSDNLALEAAKQAFELSPWLETVYVSADNQCFRFACDAENHAKAIGDLRLKMFHKKEIE